LNKLDSICFWEDEKILEIWMGEGATINTSSVLTFANSKIAEKNELLYTVDLQFSVKIILFCLREITLFKPDLISNSILPIAIIKHAESAVTCEDYVLDGRPSIVFILNSII
jgi:hypothetical protein